MRIIWVLLSCGDIGNDFISKFIICSHSTEDSIWTVLFTEDL